MADISNRPRYTPRRPRRFQFSLLTIFIVLTVCAAVAALIRAVPLPPFVRYFAAIYLIALAIPLLLRMPTIVRKLRASSAKMTQIQQERERLLESARQRLRERRSASQDGDTTED